MQEPQETQLQSLGQEDPLEEEVATHSSIFAWKTPWTEKPGKLQSVGSQRVRHDWACTYAPTNGADWIFEKLKLTWIVDRSNYNNLKDLFLKQIEYMMFGRSFQEPNIAKYYDRLEEIFADLEQDWLQNLNYPKVLMLSGIFM